MHFFNIKSYGIHKSALDVVNSINNSAVIKISKPNSLLKAITFLNVL